MAPDNLGFPGLTLTSTDKGWKRDLGETKIEIFEGPVSAIDSRFDILKATPGVDDLVRNTSDGLGTLTVTTVEDDLITTFEDNDIWEFLSQDLLKGIRTHQVFNKDGDQDRLEDTKKFFDEGNSGPGPHNSDGDPFVKYLRILRSEQTEYIRSAAILRRTLTVGPRSRQFANWTNVDRAIGIKSTGLPSSGQPLLSS